MGFNLLVSAGFKAEQYFNTLISHKPEEKARTMEFGERFIKTQTGLL
jgi:hypothetical protein